MRFETIRWRRGNVEMIDQRVLPGEVRYRVCRRGSDIFKAIKTMVVRGAPAIGVAGAFGVYLGVRGSKAGSGRELLREVSKQAGYISGARPTARNLFWAVEKMRKAAASHADMPVPEIKDLLLKEAVDILDDDKKRCLAIGRHGSRLLNKGARVLTHCNAGALATGGSGTALSVIYAAVKKIKMVYADETRPVLQGARLTVWELESEKVPVTLICDNMSADLMRKGTVDAVIVGADRIAANGDVANKIGTYGLAISAKYHKIPFYVAAPLSTFDLSLKDGSEIEIEQRSPDEVRKIRGRYITVKGVKVSNPAFDVTPSKLITAIITEKGVIERPGRAGIREHAS